MGGGGGVKVKVGVQVGNGVGESNDGVVETEGVNGCQVGEEVGNKVGVGVGVGADVEVEVAMLLPSANDNEKPPSSKPIEARAMIIPRSSCRKIFIAGSLQRPLPKQASGH
jgi:hypothetical protein